MAHKIQHLGYQISKPNTNVKVTKSDKSAFVKTQIKCYINGTKSRDYNEIQSHCKRTQNGLQNPSLRTSNQQTQYQRKSDQIR